MKSLFASLMALAAIVGFIVVHDPDLHKVCQIPGYYHRHSTLCDTYGR